MHASFRHLAVFCNSPKRLTNALYPSITELNSNLVRRTEYVSSQSNRTNADQGGTSDQGHSSHRGETGWQINDFERSHHLVWRLEVGDSCFIENCARSLELTSNILSTGLNSRATHGICFSLYVLPQDASISRPFASILTAAFTSRSCFVPHSGHVQVRIVRSFTFLFCLPQQLHS